MIGKSKDQISVVSSPSTIKKKYSLFGGEIFYFVEQIVEKFIYLWPALWSTHK